MDTPQTHILFGCGSLEAFTAASSLVRLDSLTHHPTRVRRNMTSTVVTSTAKKVKPKIRATQKQIEKAMDTAQRNEYESEWGTCIQDERIFKINAYDRQWGETPHTVEEALESINSSILEKERKAEFDEKRREEEAQQRKDKQYVEHLRGTLPYCHGALCDAETPPNEWPQTAIDRGMEVNQPGDTGKSTAIRAFKQVLDLVNIVRTMPLAHFLDVGRLVLTDISTCIPFMDILEFYYAETPDLTELETMAGKIVNWYNAICRWHKDRSIHLKMMREYNAAIESAREKSALSEQDLLKLQIEYQARVDDPNYVPIDYMHLSGTYINFLRLASTIFNKEMDCDEKFLCSGCKFLCSHFVAHHRLAYERHLQPIWLVEQTFWTGKHWEWPRFDQSQESMHTHLENVIRKVAASICKVAAQDNNDDGGKYMDLDLLRKKGAVAPADVVDVLMSIAAKLAGYSESGGGDVISTGMIRPFAAEELHASLLFDKNGEKMQSIVFFPFIAFLGNWLLSCEGSDNFSEHVKQVLSCISNILRGELNTARMFYNNGFDPPPHGLTGAAVNYITKNSHTHSGGAKNECGEHIVRQLIAGTLADTTKLRIRNVLIEMTKDLALEKEALACLYHFHEADPSFMNGAEFTLKHVSTFMANLDLCDDNLECILTSHLSGVATSTNSVGLQINSFEKTDSADFSTLNTLLDWDKTNSATFAANVLALLSSGNSCNLTLRDTLMETLHFGYLFQLTKKVANIFCHCNFRHEQAMEDLFAEMGKIGLVEMVVKSCLNLAWSRSTYDFCIFVLNYFSKSEFLEHAISKHSQKFTETMQKYFVPQIDQLRMAIPADEWNKLVGDPHSQALNLNTVQRVAKVSDEMDGLWCAILKNSRTARSLLKEHNIHLQILFLYIFLQGSGLDSRFARLENSIHILSSIMGNEVVLPWFEKICKHIPAVEVDFNLTGTPPPNRTLDKIVFEDARNFVNLVCESAWNPTSMSGREFWNIVSHLRLKGTVGDIVGRLNLHERKRIRFAMGSSRLPGTAAAIDMMLLKPLAEMLTLFVKSKRKKVEPAKLAELMVLINMHAPDFKQIADALRTEAFKTWYKTSREYTHDVEAIWQGVKLKEDDPEELSYFLEQPQPQLFKKMLAAYGERLRSDEQMRQGVYVSPMAQIGLQVTGAFTNPAALLLVGSSQPQITGPQSSISMRQGLPVSHAPKSTPLALMGPKPDDKTLLNTLNLETRNTDCEACTVSLKSHTARETYGTAGGRFIRKSGACSKESHGLWEDSLIAKLQIHPSFAQMKVADQLSKLRALMEKHFKITMLGSKQNGSNWKVALYDDEGKPFGSGNNKFYRFYPALREKTHFSADDAMICD